MAGELARRIDGIPVVQSETERDALYPTPARDQRVQLRATGEFQRHDGVEWVTDAFGSAGPGVVNVMARPYHAVGSGDETTALQAAATAAGALGAGTILLFPPGSTFTATGQLTIPAGVRVWGYGATLHFGTNATNQGLVLGGSGCRVHGLTVAGPQFAAYSDGQIGIKAAGAATGTPLTDIVIRDVDISGFGQAAIDLTYVERFHVHARRLSDCYKYGLALRSCRFGSWHLERCENINADGVVPSNAYGCTMTKNTAPDATDPVCHDIEGWGNFRNIRTWNGIGTHGGYNLTVGGTFRDVRMPINFDPYIGTAGSEQAPRNCHIRPSTFYISHDAEEVITRANSSAAILVAGDAPSGQRATGITIDPCVIDGHGSATNNATGNNTDAAISVQYADQVTIGKQTIRNAGSYGLLLRSVTNLDIDVGQVQGLAGAAATAASGTITFAANPSDGDTITLNSKVWTFKSAVTDATSQIAIGANLATTLANAVTALTASTDGRISTASYAASSPVLTITAKTIGRAFNTVWTLAASVATVSGSALAGGAAGAAAVQINAITSGGASTGRVRGLLANVGAHVGVQMTDDNQSVHFEGNRHLGTGPLYDCRGSSNVPQSGAGDIDDLFRGRGTNNPPSIAAAGSATIYLPAPGVVSTAATQVSTDRTLNGLTLTAQPGNHYVALRLDNPSAGAVDLASTTFLVYARQLTTSAAGIS